MSEHGDWFPLEKFFFAKARAQSTEMAYTGVDYVAHYQSTLSNLRERVYPLIDAGLSANSADKGGIYTLHNAAHFNEVVKYAGNLIGLGSAGDLPPNVQLTGYEAFVLLLAIRVHDAGNGEGREDHEKRCFAVLSEVLPSSIDDFEKQTVDRIASAHGGRTAEGNKDTISELQEDGLVGNAQVRERALAAITRFADEICESQNRAARYLLDKQGKLPVYNEIYHKYAEAIKGVAVSQQTRRLRLQFMIRKADIMTTFGGGRSDKIEKYYLIDYIVTRLTKMNLERIYYNTFVDQPLKIKGMDIDISLCEQDGTLIQKWKIPIGDQGYPEGHFTWYDGFKLLNGEELKKVYSEKQ